MISCINCKFYSSNPYLHCAVNPTARGGCEIGELGEPLEQLKVDFYVEWHNGEMLNVNEFTGIDRDLVLMGVRVDELEEAKRRVESLAKTGINYQEALIAVRSISSLGSGASVVDIILNNLGQLP